MNSLNSKYYNKYLKYKLKYLNIYHLSSGSMQDDKKLELIQICIRKLDAYIRLQLNSSNLDDKLELILKSLRSIISTFHTESKINKIKLETLLYTTNLEQKLIDKAIALNNKTIYDLVNKNIINTLYSLIYLINPTKDPTTKDIYKNSLTALYTNTDITNKILFNEINNDTDLQFSSHTYDKRFKQSDTINNTFKPLLSIIGVTMTALTGIIGISSPYTFVIILPTFFSAYMLYMQYVKMTNYSYVAGIILTQLNDMLTDIYEMNLFYNNIKKYPTIKFTNNDSLVKVEKQIYKIMYMIINNLDIVGSYFSPKKLPSTKENIKAFYDKLFDLKNPVYIYDYKSQKFVKDETNTGTKLRFTTLFCDQSNNEYLDYINSTKKYCNNYNDKILNIFKKKIQSYLNSPIISSINELPTQIGNYMIANQRYTELIREYTIIGVTFTLAISRYNLHINKLSILYPTEIANIYKIIDSNVPLVKKELDTITQKFDEITIQRKPLDTDESNSKNENNEVKEFDND